MPKVPIGQLPWTLGADVAIDPSDLRILAPNDPIPGIPFFFREAFLDAPTSSLTVTLPYAWKFVFTSVVKRGGAGAAGNTLQLLQAGNPITEAISTNIANNVQIYNTQNIAPFDDFNAATSMTITNTKIGGNGSALVWILGVRTG